MSRVRMLGVASGGTCSSEAGRLAEWWHSHGAGRLSADTVRGPSHDSAPAAPAAGLLWLGPGAAQSGGTCADGSTART
eukprot:5799844-Prymnesium_polylepis.1